MMKIIELKKEEFTGYKVDFDYVTDSVYDIIETAGNGLEKEIKIIKTPMAQRVVHFDDKLFQPYRVQPRAWGLFDEEKGSYVGYLETDAENWSNRLRVNILTVKREYRGAGNAKRLMDVAKRQAKEEKRRAVILETQSCNTGAIAFYLKQGFVFAGLLTTDYTSYDIEKKEVRIELVYRLDEFKARLCADPKA